MSDKQRADHVQAKYWNGFITRTEAQTVFEQYGQTIKAQAVAIQQLDAVVSCIADRLGVSAEVVNEWIKTKVQEATKNAQVQAPQEAAPDSKPIAITDLQPCTGTMSVLDVPVTPGEKSPNQIGLA